MYVTGTHPCQVAMYIRKFSFFTYLVYEGYVTPIVVHGWSLRRAYVSVAYTNLEGGNNS